MKRLMLIIVCLLQTIGCTTSSQIRLNVTAIQIAKNVEDRDWVSYDILSVNISETPRIKVSMEIHNDGTDSLLFIGSRHSDIFTINYVFHGKRISQKMDLLLMPPTMGYIIIPPGNNRSIEITFPTPFTNDKNNPLNKREYSEFLFKIMPTIFIEYKRNSEYYKEHSRPIRITLSDWDDIMITKVPKEKRD